jgi:hypothetical protein
LLPLLLTVSLFFFSQVIIVPDFLNPQEAKLSKHQEVKTLSCISAKGQIKSPTSRVAKVAQFFELCSTIAVISKPTLRLAACNQTSHFFTTISASTAPARAPPA